MLDQERKSRRTGRWYPAMSAGWYISDDYKLNAQLRSPGKYPYGNCGEMVKCSRHYAIFHIGQEVVIGTARTLAEAERYI